MILKFQNGVLEIVKDQTPRTPIRSSHYRAGERAHHYSGSLWAGPPGMEPVKAGDVLPPEVSLYADKAVHKAIARRDDGTTLEALEMSPPVGLVARDVRLAVQRLVDSGRVVLDKEMRLISTVSPDVEADKADLERWREATKDAKDALGQGIHEEAKRELAALAPIPMILFCPKCCERHIDEGEFSTKAHHTHACQKCGMVWRPAIQAKVGVQFLPGFKNED